MTLETDESEPIRGTPALAPTDRIQTTHARPLIPGMRPTSELGRITIFIRRGKGNEAEWGSPMRRSFNVIVVSALVGMGLTQASAAQPANRACLGNDVSGYAQDFAPWGQTIKAFGIAEGGAGEDLQAHMAGLIPDEVIPNSCND